MKPEHKREIELTREAMLALQVTNPSLRGDSLLNAATELAGYDIGESGVDQCDRCGTLYHRDYGGEYVDPQDNSLLVELQEFREFSRLRSLRRLSYAHYCGFSCLLDDVSSGVVRWRPHRTTKTKE